MPRTKRHTPGGMIYHVLNRANDRKVIFESSADYLALLEILRDTREERPMRILAYCLMPNHWHLLLWPERDGDLSAFMHQFTTTHTRRWHLNRNSTGQGHLYQGPYKYFPVQDDDHFYTVCRYVERNAIRANLVSRAEAWRWNSLWQRNQNSTPPDYPVLALWPVPRPAGWIDHVNQPQSEAELADLATCIHRGRPFGSSEWQQSTAKRLGLESTLRPRGRPKKQRS
ncbi:MAG: transposase [Pirellulaceae bacterium]